MIACLGIERAQRYKQIRVMGAVLVFKLLDGGFIGVILDNIQKIINIMPKEDHGQINDGHVS